MREKLEQDVVAQISVDELMRHTAFLAEEDRESGSPGEARACRYFKEFMEGLGFETQIMEIENFISLPINAVIKVLSPEGRELTGLTPSFSASCPEGIEGDLIYLPKGVSSDFAGKIVMQEGLAAPLPTFEMERQGAKGQVWINGGELPVNCIASTIWGHPTPETSDRLPKTPMLSLSRPDGEYLKSVCKKGPVRVRLVTELKTGFMKVPLAVAEVRGVTEPDKYVLFNGHIDSWHKGASDNGTANACMLETARVVSKHRDRLRRGIRFLWWSGHSQGRYSGSTWYVDHFWADLYRHAIVHLNVDSLGCRGATYYGEVECTSEMYDLGREVIKKYTGQTPEYDRMGHSGDNSFWGVGLPTLFQLLSRQPTEPAGKEVLVKGLPWFWHTTADTIDKIDPDILLNDTRVYMAALWSLCVNPVLPMNFVPVAEELERVLSGLQTRASGSFDLNPAMERARTLRVKAEKLFNFCQRVESEVNEGSFASIQVAEELNNCLMKLSRLLIPVNYSAVDPFDIDIAVPIPPIPRLQRVAHLGNMDPNSWTFKFLERKMLRERNRVCFALEEASKSIDETLTKLNC
jgi:hypothetical protein